MLCEAKKCTGCGACENICKHNAITMKMNVDGFLYPSINRSCIGCKECESACPVLQYQNSNHIPKAYAAIHIDKEILKKSASGGVFTALSELTLEQGGYVYGAAYDDDLTPRMMEIRNSGELGRLRGSKYVQAITGKIYQSVEEALHTGKMVLFTGVGCQIAGLYQYLGREYENLLTVDIVCSGVPSLGIFREYILDVEKEIGEKVVYINQTDGTEKWSVLIQKHIKILTQSGQAYDWDSHHDFYLTSFLDGRNVRECCCDCKFAALPRTADITIGDYFGLGVLFPYPGECRAGVSQVLVNNAHGMAYMEKCRCRLIILERPLKECLYFNLRLWKGKKAEALRRTFFEDYQRLGYALAKKKYFTGNIKFLINRKLRKISKKILGDRLTARLIYISYKRRGIINEANQHLAGLHEK